MVERSEASAFSVSGNGFEFDQGPTAATVHPGGPFHGSATFQRSSAAGAAGSWTGSLPVSFLDGGVALTGGGIERR